MELYLWSSKLSSFLSWNNGFYLFLFSTLWTSSTFYSHPWDHFWRQKRSVFNISPFLFIYCISSANIIYRLCEAPTVTNVCCNYPWEPDFSQLYFFSISALYLASDLKLKIPTAKCCQKSMTKMPNNIS